MFDQSKLADVLVAYKQNFVSKQWGEEKYKWEAVRWFQDNWDVNATDFAEMLSRSLDMVDRKHRDFTDEDIQKLADTFTAFQDGTLEDVKGFCAVADLQEIEKQDFILTPGRYVPLIRAVMAAPISEGGVVLPNLGAVDDFRYP